MSVELNNGKWFKLSRGLHSVLDVPQVISPIPAHFQWWITKICLYTLQKGAHKISRSL